MDGNWIATNHLREMLDKRNVKYRIFDDSEIIKETTWCYNNDNLATFVEEDSGETIFYINTMYLNVNQAIAATLGNCECEMKELERFDGMDPHYRCSICGHENYEYSSPRFCPSCGARVRL